MGKIKDMTTAEIQATLEDANEENYAFAYLSASANTTMTAAETWYPILGTFVNVFSNFELDTDQIKCIATRTNKYEIDWHIKCASDTVAATINVTIKVNGVVVETSKMGAYAKTSGEPVSFGGTEVVNLTANNTVQLVIETNKAGSTITVGQFVTSITKFVQKRQ